MTTYSIHFVNNHGDGKYCFFNQTPIVSGSTSDAGVFTNVWISKSVPKGAHVDIATTETFYGWTGQGPTTLQNGSVVIDSGMALPATLGTGGAPGSTFDVTKYGDTPDIKLDGTATGNASSFVINTDETFIADDNFLIGLGQLDDKNNVVPSAVIAADQNMSTQIMPIMKFYVSKMNAVQGTVVDFASASKDAGVMDFTALENQGLQFVVVTHNPNGSFTVKFSDQKSFFETRSLSFAKKAHKPDNARIRQIQEQIATLQKLLAELLSENDDDNDVSVGVDLTFLGTVLWQAGTAVTAIATGAGLIAKYLVDKGYSVELDIDAKNWKVGFKLTAPKPSFLDGELVGGVPSNVSTDWANAVKADKADKITDEGVVPSTGKQVLSASDITKKKKAARAVLAQSIGAINGH